MQTRRRDLPRLLLLDRSHRLSDHRREPGIWRYGLLSLAIVVSIVAPLSAQLPEARPVAERVIEIAAWESSSVSPFGATRIGGTEARRFAISGDGQWIASED